MNLMASAKKLLSALAALFIGAYFIALTKDVVRCYFSPDDCMNLYRSWDHPAAALVKANFLFFLNSPFYRPMGSAWYRAIFELAGFNPVPFHIVNLFTLAANMWFTYCVARRLSGSKTAAAIAALLISYHGAFTSLYFDTGYIYDVVCFFFYFAGFAFYLRVRSRPRPPKWWELAILTVLYVCALNAKEMAVTLPLFLAAYEWLYRRKTIRGPSNWWRWLTTFGRGVLVTVVLAFVFVAGRTTTASGLMTMTVYRPEFSWQRFMETSDNFVSALFFRDNLLPSAVVLAIWAGLFGIAWAARSRTLKFAWLFLMLSPLPVAFIDPRGPAQYYIPYFGWVLYAATLLVEGTQLLFAKMPRVSRFTWAAHALLILCVGGFMYVMNRPYGWLKADAVALEGEELRVVMQQIHQLRPALRRASRSLFLNDPIKDRWRMTFLMRLSYRDNDLIIDRVRYMTPPPTAREIASYDYVFDYHHGRFFSAPHSRPTGPQPEIVYEYGYPAAYRSDWSRIRPWNPARRGERVISMVQDLGDTAPPVPHDKPFPDGPYADVESPVELRIDGQPVEVLMKFGWPDQVNRYRVDFQIPKSVRPGQTEVVISCQHATGLPTPISVQ